MRRKTKSIILTLTVILMIVYGLSTGGLACARRDSFYGLNKNVNTGGSQPRISLEPGHWRIWFPFVGYYYRTGMPCDLRVQIWDRSKTYASITINEIVVDYSDGDTVRHTEPWSRILQPHTQSSSKGVVLSEWVGLSETIPDVVTRHKDVSVTITGKLIQNDGTAIDFSTTDSFKAYSDTKFTTYWKVLLSR